MERGAGSLGFSTPEANHLIVLKLAADCPHQDRIT
jgi:hypothetical protein